MKLFVRSSMSRREFLARAGMGMGALSLGALAQAESASPLAPRAPHFAPKAKRVIHFFLNGGPSHVDTFDPKPMLAKYAGKPLPGEYLRTERKTGAAFPSPFKFTRHGQSGLEISELFAKTAAHADSIAVVRSMYAQVPNHEPSLMLMNCGDSVQARPSFGAWTLYGLGTENQNLPGFVAMCPGGMPIKDSENWQAGFLPGAFQGTFVDPQHREVEKLIENIRNKQVSQPEQRRQLDLLMKLNQKHLEQRQKDMQLESRIQSFELAYRMQSDAADAFDISREPEPIRNLYGDTPFARSCLLARRLVEDGVRFVTVYYVSNDNQPWDTHANHDERHRRLCLDGDQAAGALISDLKQRGMLDDTLVIWGGEFGRTPYAEVRENEKTKKKEPAGRDHHHTAFSMLLAGGGAKGGMVYGTTDELGMNVVENPVHVHDFHATILHLLGIDHERLTYRYAGRDFRLTDVHGRVVTEILA